MTNEEKYLNSLIQQAMQDEWNEICDDTGCHPLDITHGKKSVLFFQPNHWADAVAKNVAATLASITAGSMAVPIDPTPEMIDAACKDWMALYPSFDGEKPQPTVGEVVLTIFNAMLLASKLESEE